MKFSDVLQCGLKAHQTGKSEKGIKGVSTLFGMPWFDVVKGMVPDYMHGVLLGVTKKVLSLLLSSSGKDEPFYVGNRITEIDCRLLAMKPTDDIIRLPRALNDHFHQYKAAELQTWLLFYSIPSLSGILPERYLNHLALMVEGIYLLLKDCQTETDITRASHVLKKFYCEFAELYGYSNVTLNLHNMGLHLATYVKWLGPLWAWSCFPFEDMNGVLIDHVHGTGNVCSQILKTLHTQKSITIDVDKISNPKLKAFSQSMMKKARQVKAKRKTLNCDIAGAITSLKLNGFLREKIQAVTGIDAIEHTYKVLRIIKDDQVIYSTEYTRMEKRIGNTVSIHINDSEFVVGKVKYFIFLAEINKCLAVVAVINVVGYVHDEVQHLKLVNSLDSSDTIVVFVEQIKEKLLHLTGNEHLQCVACVPNRYGQCS